MNLPEPRALPFNRRASSFVTGRAKQFGAFRAGRSQRGTIELNRKPLAMLTEPIRILFASFARVRLVPGKSNKDARETVGARS